MEKLDKIILLMVIILVGFSGILIYQIHSSCETITYIDTISNVNKDSIVLGNDTVLFVNKIQKYNWKIGTKYKITIEKCNLIGSEITNVEKLWI